jgi:hypothetical protein
MRRPTTTVLLAFLLAGPGLARAQETTGSIEGRIVDPQGLPVAGATVTATGPQGARVAAATSDGRFVVPFLTPGTYAVRVEALSFKLLEQRDIVVQLGQTVELPLRLDVGAVAETIQVTASAPIVDVSRTTVGAIIASDLLQRVPVGRRITDALYFAPGVTSSNSGGIANPSISGGTALDNQYVVDGVNITNTGFGGIGSYSVTFGSLGTAIPFDFVSEIQVKTTGYDAEFGQSTGGVVNVITKSGSNTLRGSAFGYARPQKLEGNFTKYQSANGSVSTEGTRVYDGGLEGGGSLLPDRLFFFGAIDRTDEQALYQAPAFKPLASLGIVPRDRQIDTYAAKATLQVGPSHRIDATFFGDPSHGDSGLQRVSALLAQQTTQFSELNKFGGHNQGVSYRGVLGPRWLFEASFGRASNNIVETPSNNAWNVRNFTVTPTVISGGLGFYQKGDESLSRQYQAKATTVVAGHEFRFGFQFQDVVYNNLFDRTGPTFTLPDGRQSATGAQLDIRSDPTLPGGVFYRVSRVNLTNADSTTQHNVNVFVQDTWRHGHLTLRPGLRYDQQTINGQAERMTLKNNWAPRLGAAYDPTGTGRSKIYASWGVFYAQLPNDLAAKALTVEPLATRVDYYDANLTRPIPSGVLVGGVTNHFVSGAGQPWVVDPNVKSTYTMDTSVGFEFEPFAATRLGISYTHRGISRLIEDLSPFPVVAADLLGAAYQAGNEVLTNPDPKRTTLAYLANLLGVTPAPGLAASYETPIHRYDAVTVSADRRFSNNWALQASYTWSRLYGDYEGFYQDANAQGDPGLSTYDDFPTNDPSYTQIGVPKFGYSGDIRYQGSLGAGPLPLDRPHQIKVYANYRLPVGLNLGLAFSARSGRPLTALAANPQYGSPGEIPLTPRGGGFTTVDGFKTRTPFEYYPDVHADYAVRLQGRYRAVFLADVFNILNLTRTTNYDAFTELGFGVPNPDFGKPVSQFPASRPPQFQTPRQVRLGVRFEF